MEYCQWVPEEALFFWRLRENLLKTTADRQPIETEHLNIRRDDLVNFALHNTQIERSGLALLTIPKLFTEFEPGEAPEKLWRDISELENVSPGGFISSVVSAYLGPSQATEMMTLAERTTWKKNVIKKSEELRSLIVNTKLDNILEHYFFGVMTDLHERLKQSGVVINDSVKDAYYVAASSAPLLSEILFELMSNDQGSVLGLHELVFQNKDISVDPSRPRDPHSYRTYFARYMTEFFMRYVGEPKRQIVLTLIRCLFQNATDFDDRMLRRIAPVTP